ncbi:ImmA/IrrE family metallo-endopeptidase [Lactiplantibacillus modestisalitolerans]|uniref:ImmA/IrrE family metallo-endopeptidase n=1 Tax=Lactiplantibacillus modestisalitolerans TaxID=1457219 RepID=A0ABV5WTT9_9LACO|nr:ImmA/IrrE family metallo-endopeptidase [Lactiplantibacillus modestisalitolerans]
MNSYKLYLQVHQLTDRLGTSNPFDIADSLGYTVEYASLGSLKGLCTTASSGDVYIGLSDELRESPEKYVVMAHELKHGLDHTSCAALYTIGNNWEGKMEREANLFACSELTPLQRTIWRTASKLQRYPISIRSTR